MARACVGRWPVRQNAELAAVHADRITSTGQLAYVMFKNCTMSDGTMPCHHHIHHVARARAGDRCLRPVWPMLLSYQPTGTRSKHTYLTYSGLTLRQSCIHIHTSYVMFSLCPDPRQGPNLGLVRIRSRSWTAGPIPGSGPGPRPKPTRDWGWSWVWVWVWGRAGLARSGAAPDGDRGQPVGRRDVK